MKAIDISTQIKKYKKGWVALDNSYKVVETAASFEEINKKLEKYKNKEKILLFPATSDYSGSIIKEDFGSFS